MQQIRKCEPSDEKGENEAYRDGGEEEGGREEEGRKRRRRGDQGGEERGLTESRKGGGSGTRWQGVARVEKSTKKGQAPTQRPL